MKTIDLAPLYRSSIGFDRLGALLDHALTAETKTNTYPPYNIEMVDESHYAITLAVAGFSQNEIDIQIENGMLSIRGNKPEKSENKFLHQGIANRNFECKFNLAEHIEVTNADLSNGLLVISLVKEIPETMKPKTIAINKNSQVLEHEEEEKKQPNAK
jgi:molecular chaperone IbpA